MSEDLFKPTMSQKIFSMDLNVETVSIYLLCCALADANVSIAKQALVAKWNGETASLDEGLRQLEGKCIIRETDRSSSIFELVEDTHWV